MIGRTGLEDTQRDRQAHRLRYPPPELSGTTGPNAALTRDPSKSKPTTATPPLDMIELAHIMTPQSYRTGSEVRRRSHRRAPPIALWIALSITLSIARPVRSRIGCRPRAVACLPRSAPIPGAKAENELRSRLTSRQVAH
jgi:hypothetical protein